jgi:competence protein ComEA
MLKDLFTFTKNERNGIIVLLFLMLLVIFAPAAYRRISESSPKDYSEFVKAVEEFEKARLAKLDEEKPIEISKSAFEVESFNLDFFDPNSINHAELIQMGLPERLCNTIMNFRKSGGEFSQKEDLRKIFGMTDNIYYQIESYIIIPEKAESKNINSEVLAERKLKNNNSDFENPTLHLRININMADSTELTMLRGIGQVFSNRIIKYREMLGGFHSPEQLLEVHGMDTVRYNAIKEFIFTEGNIYAININSAEVDDLLKHPYINRNIANSIVMLRKQHGKYKCVEDIKKSALIKDDFFIKIKPYLKIDD